MEVGSTGAGGVVDPRSRDVSDSLRGIELDDFLDLMIAELQNQDPLNPLENDEILQQLSQLREIGSTDKLSETLESVLLGQLFSNAGTLIGRQVSGLSDQGHDIEGTVDRVTIEDGTAQLHVGESTLPLANIREILPAAQS